MRKLIFILSLFISLTAISQPEAMFHANNTTASAPSYSGYDFEFNSSIAELTGKVSTSYLKYSDNSSMTPSFDADGVLCDAATYGYTHLATAFTASSNWTIEFRVKISSGGETIHTITGTGDAAPNSLSALTSEIYIDTDMSSYGWMRIFGQYWFNLLSTWNNTSLHTIQIVNAGGTMELFADGISKGTNTAPSSISIQDIGAGHQTAGVNIRGTIDYFKMQ